jgi:hypothetical protein
MMYIDPRLTRKAGGDSIEELGNPFMGKISVQRRIVHSTIIKVNQILLCTSAGRVPTLRPG